VIAAVYGARISGNERRCEERVKVVTAIIKPFLLDDATEALRDIGVHGMTVTECLVDLVPKLRIDVLVEDDVCDRAVVAISDDRVAGSIGEVWVTPASGVWRIRTGEVGEVAI